MPWGTEKFLEAQRGANYSVERANQAADERKRALWAFEDQDRQARLREGDLQARLAEQSLRQGDERFAEDRRRFDTRQAQFDGLMRMLFGGGQEDQGGPNALRRMRMGGMGGYTEPDDGLDRRSINNSLAAYLRGRM